MPFSAPVDGFRLSYTDTGDPAAPAVVLLHGWPGNATDYRSVVPLLSAEHRVVVPDLRGFGESDRHLLDPQRYYSPSAQAGSVASLIAELGLVRPVLGGYDIGSRIAQTVAREHPDQVGGLVIAPPLPGAGRRVLEPDRVPEVWYQYFHRTALSVPLLDGQRPEIAAYLRHFWTHWAGPGVERDTPEFEALVDSYARPGAFEASTNWYRVGAGSVATALAEQPPPPQGRIDQPTQVIWPADDPLFPPSWADRIDAYFSRARLHRVGGIGHFVPLEAPAALAELVREVVAELARPENYRPRPSVTVRPARPDDDRALAVLDAQAWPAELQVVPPQPADEPFFGRHRAVEDVLVAELDGEVVGYSRTGPHVPLENNRHVLHLDAVAVDPSARGAGAGSALVAASIERARTAGYRKLGLRALSINDRAIALYRRLGFVEEGRLREEFRLPDGRYADDVWFALVL